MYVHSHVMVDPGDSFKSSITGGDLLSVRNSALTGRASFILSANLSELAGLRALHSELGRALEMAAAAATPSTRDGA